MFIFERIIGIGIYLIVTLFICLLISQTKIKIKSIFFISIVLLTIIAFFYLPYETADIYKIEQKLKKYSTYQFDSFVNNKLSSSSTPVSEMIFWLFGNYGNIKLLSTINCFVCYSIIFYIARKSIEINHINRNDTILVYVFIMASEIFMPIISGIRMMLALSLVGLCLFQEFYLKKFNLLHIVLYVLAIFIHNIAIVIIFFSLLCGVIQKVSKGWVRLLLLIVGSALFVLLVYRYNDLFDSIIDKFEYYVVGESYSNVWEYILAGVALLLNIIITIFDRKKNHKRDFYFYFSITLIIVSMILCFSFSIFHRLNVETNSIMIIPVLTRSLNNCGFSKLYNNRQRVLIYCFIALLLFINISRGSLCGLKLFELGA